MAAVTPAPDAAPLAAAQENKMPEFEPPQACVQRIIKGVLPDNCQITKESKAAFAKAAGIFIIYLTTCANDFCKENRRSTISSVDIITAIKELEFHDLIGPLEEFLEHYRKDSTAKKEKAASSTSMANADSFAAEEDPPLSSAVMDGDNPTTGTPPEAASA